MGAERGLPGVETYSHRLDDPGRDAWQRPEDVVALLDCQPGTTVVDLGVGTGYFLPHLSRAVGPAGAVLGLDISEPVIEWVRQRVEEEGLSNVQVRTVAADDPELARHSVDRVLVVNTWHHITGRVGYARRLRAGLRPGGRLLIIDFTIESPVGPPTDKRLTPETVAAELNDAGFQTWVAEESLPYQYAIVGVVR
jgi:cyclopropane fatty-acyl-phospholipid synthase-like methyltransferase